MISFNANISDALRVHCSRSSSPALAKTGQKSGDNVAFNASLIHLLILYKLER